MRYILAAVAVSACFMASCSSGNTDHAYDKMVDTREAKKEIKNNLDSYKAQLKKVDLNDIDPESADWMPAYATITPSGLGIVIENPGDDRRADDNTQMLIHYRGHLTDGTVFDSSYDRGTPAVFTPAQVVPGFGEGIKMIGAGGKATLYIPSDLGYGRRGAPQGGIGPNENLIFDIEVIDMAK